MSLKVFKDVEPVSDLKPLKAIILGPPASGKTKLSERLCRRYGAHYVNVKTMIQDTLDGLEESIERAKQEMEAIQMQKAKAQAGEGAEEEEEEIEGFAVNNLIIEDCQQQIDVINEAMVIGKKLSDDMACNLMRNFLSSSVCQTRGYVLDGFPKTVKQATLLFGSKFGKIEERIEEPMKEEDGETSAEALEVIPTTDAITSQSYNLIINPDFVINLDATDDFLCERVMNLPQKLVFGTHFDEVSMLRRLAEYHENNQLDQSVLKYFDDSEMNPIVINLIDAETTEELTIDDVFRMVCDIFGEPIPGFGLSKEEEEAIRKLEIEQQRLIEEEVRLERQLVEKKAKQEYEDKMEKWSETLEKLQLEEEKVYAAQSEPLRFYLMKYVFPTLSKGLVEVAKIKPEDPIDFLAEYLFKENPEGRMFDPSYTREGEKILQQYEEEVKTLSENNSELI